jgi:SAM-dependent methyltransferase
MIRKVEELIQALSRLFSKDIIRITVSNKRSASQKAQKVTVRPIVSRGQTLFQFERIIENQAFHENMTKDAAMDMLGTLLKNDYRQLDARTAGWDVSIKLSKKEKLLYSEKKNDRTGVPQEHNRAKKYILNEGEFSPVLCELGVQTKDGHIAAPMYDKFRQINRFLEFIDDIASKDDAEEFKIIDFGCGKSYLTFLVYEYFIKRGRRVRIVGLDLKRAVIEKCRDIAARHGCDGLSFEVGDIKDYSPAFKPDMVISLHACDTATDFAIYNAISWGARYILAIPCCQHELNLQVKKSGRLLSSYGLLRERFLALSTDAIRAKLLEYSDYDVSVMEFIDMEHSPKNIMIRAKKRTRPRSDEKKALLLDEAEDFLKQYGVTQTLHTLITKHE